MYTCTYADMSVCTVGRSLAQTDIKCDDMPVACAEK